MALAAASRWSEEQLETAYKELQWFHRTIGYAQYPVINTFDRTPKLQPKAKKRPTMRGAGTASTA